MTNHLPGGRSRICLFGLLGAGLLQIGACCSSLTTEISGRITDKVTGQPVENASVELYVFDYAHEHDFYAEKYTQTDAKGGYYLTADGPCTIEGGHASVLKDGYWSVYNKPVVGGKAQVLDFQLTPEDAVLRVHLKNVSASNSLIYFKYQCNTGDEPWSYCFGKSYPDTLQADQEAVKLIAVPGDTYNRVFWDVQDFNKGKAAHLDSIYCARNDTTDLNINF